MKRCCDEVPILRRALELVAADVRANKVPPDWNEHTDAGFVSYYVARARMEQPPGCGPGSLPNEQWAPRARVLVHLGGEWPMSADSWDSDTRHGAD